MEGKKTSRGALQSGHRCGQVAPSPSVGPGRPCGTCLRIVPSPKGLRMPLCYSCPCLVPGMSSWPCLRTNPTSLSLTPGHETALGAEVQELPTAALPWGRARMASLPLLRARGGGQAVLLRPSGSPCGI